MGARSRSAGPTPTRPPIRSGRRRFSAGRAPDGLEIEGLLTYPIGYEKGRRYPLVVVIHGGPSGVFSQSYIAARGLYPVAAFAAEGWAVLRCNIRGSSGYGKAFRLANYRDWGGKDYRDLMAGVDKVIAMGVADPDRLGVMGWSYGGFMTSWVITQTKRFKAASVGAGVTNLMSFSGTTDIPDFILSYFGAEFWQDPEVIRKHSAMFNIKGATTPTLIQHGEQDVRVPVGQGYELYSALKRQGTVVKMVVYPRQPHGDRRAPPHHRRRETEHRVVPASISERRNSGLLPSRCSRARAPPLAARVGVDPGHETNAVAERRAEFAPEVRDDPVRQGVGVGIPSGRRWRRPARPAPIGRSGTGEPRPCAP